MKPQIDRVEFVRDFLNRIFDESLHAKRIESLSNGALGVMTSASLAVSIIGHSLAQARGLIDKHAIKQVDRLLSNRGIVVWEMFAPWAREVVGPRKEIVVAMDWTDFDADSNSQAGPLVERSRGLDGDWGGCVCRPLRPVKRRGIA